jgi:chemotaxis protein MotB
MSKKHKCPEFENHERWLVAYADMMTLLFALFVVLYSLTNVEMEKLKKAATSIQRAFGMATEDVPGATGHVDGNARRDAAIFRKMKGNTSRESLATRNRRERAAIIETDKKMLEETMRSEFKGEKESPMVAGKEDERVIYFLKDPDGIRISLLSRGFFKPNRAELDETPEVRNILRGIAAAISGIGRTIRVEGHTDSTQTNTKIAFRGINLNISNWELSSLRASTVLRFLTGEAANDDPRFKNSFPFPRTQVYAAGFGDTRPVATNKTPEGRAMNRRVDIKVLYQNPDDSPDIDQEQGGMPNPSAPAPSAPAAPTQEVPKPPAH